MITSPLMDEEYEHDVVNFRQNIADRANTLRSRIYSRHADIRPKNE